MKELFNLNGDPLGVESISSEAAGSTAAQPEGMLSMSLIFSALRHRWPWIVLLALPMVGLSAFYVQRRMPPIFAAESMIKVEPTVPHVAFTDEEWRAQSITGFYNDHVRTITRLAKSRAVLEEAVSCLAEKGVTWLPEGVPAWKASDHLGARIQVNQLRDTHLFTVRFEAADALLVAPVANAVADALLEVLSRDQREFKSRTLKTLDEERLRLETELDGAYAGLDELSNHLGSVLMDEGQNTLYERLNKLEEGMTKVFVNRVQAEGAYLDAEIRARQLLSRAPNGELQALLDDDPAFRDARVSYGRLKLQEDRATGHLSDDHPERQQSLKRLESALAQLNATEEEVRARLGTRLNTQREEQAELLVLGAQAQMRGALLSEKNMDVVLGEARSNLAEYVRTRISGQKLRAMTDRLLASIKILDQRREQVLIESRAPARLTVTSRAVRPFEPSGDRRAMMLLLALMTTGGASFALAVGIELLKRPVRGSRDAEQLGLRVIVGDNEGPARLAFELEATLRGGASGLMMVPSSPGERAEEHLLNTTRAVTRLLEVEPSERWIDLSREGDPEEPLQPTRLVHGSESLAQFLAHPRERARLEKLIRSLPGVLVTVPAPKVSPVCMSVAGCLEAVVLTVPGRDRARDLKLTVASLQAAGIHVRAILISDDKHPTASGGD